MSDVSAMLIDETYVIISNINLTIKNSTKNIVMQQKAPQTAYITHRQFVVLFVVISK